MAERDIEALHAKLLLDNFKISVGKEAAIREVKALQESISKQHKEITELIKSNKEKRRIEETLVKQLEMCSLWRPTDEDDKKGYLNKKEIELVDKEIEDLDRKDRELARKIDARLKADQAIIDQLSYVKKRNELRAEKQRIQIELMQLEHSIEACADAERTYKEKIEKPLEISFGVKIATLSVENAKIVKENAQLKAQYEEKVKLAQSLRDKIALALKNPAKFKSPDLFKPSDSLLIPALKSVGYKDVQSSFKNFTSLTSTTPLLQNKGSPLSILNTPRVDASKEGSKLRVSTPKNSVAAVSEALSAEPQFKNRSINETEPANEIAEKQSDEVPFQAVDGTSPSRDVVKTLPSTDVDEAMSSQDADEAMPSQDGDEVMPSQDGDEAMPSQDDDDAMPSQDADEALPSQAPERTMPSQATEQTVPCQATEESMMNQAVHEEHAEISTVVQEEEPAAPTAMEAIQTARPKGRDLNRPQVPGPSRVVSSVQYKHRVREQKRPNQRRLTAPSDNVPKKVRIATTGPNRPPNLPVPVIDLTSDDDSVSSERNYPSQLTSQPKQVVTFDNTGARVVRTTNDRSQPEKSQHQGNLKRRKRTTNRKSQATSLRPNHAEELKQSLPLQNQLSTAVQQLQNRPHVVQQLQNRPHVVQQLQNRPSAVQQFQNRLPAVQQLQSRPSAVQQAQIRPSATQKLQNRPPAVQQFQNRPPAVQNSQNHPPAAQQLQNRPPAVQQIQIRPPDTRKLQTRLPAVQQFQNRPPSAQQLQNRPPDVQQCQNRSTTVQADEPGSTRTSNPGARRNLSRNPSEQVNLNGHRPSRPQNVKPSSSAIQAIKPGKNIANLSPNENILVVEIPKAGTSKAKNPCARNVAFEHDASAKPPTSSQVNRPARPELVKSSNEVAQPAKLPPSADKSLELHISEPASTEGPNPSVQRAQTQSRPTLAGQQLNPNRGRSPTVQISGKPSKGAARAAELTDCPNMTVKTQHDLSLTMSPSSVSSVPIDIDPEQLETMSPLIGSDDFAECLNNIMVNGQPFEDASDFFNENYNQPKSGGFDLFFSGSDAASPADNASNKDFFSLF